MSNDRRASPYFSLFVGGDYRKILELSSDSSRSAPQLADLPWIIGAMTFLGRTHEAEGLFQGHKNEFSLQEKVVSQFYLGISLCREGRWKASREYLLNNRKIARQSEDFFLRFFVFQGLAFYRYMTGRLKSAIHWAERAVKEASAGNFPYGLALGFEILAHSQISSGQIHAGFRHLEYAEDKASLLGQGSVIQAIQISRALYMSSLAIGQESGEIKYRLESHIGDEFFEDSYTQASLHLELSRILLLRGEVSKAKIQLELSSALVYRIDNFQLELTYNLLLALLLRMQGELHHALSIVRAAKHRVIHEADIRSHMKVMGFEAQLLKSLGQSAEFEALLPPLRRLKKLCGGQQAARILNRIDRSQDASVRPGEDKLGDLIDRSIQFKEGVVKELIQGAWFGLLSSPLNIQAAEQVLFFDAEPGSLTIFDKGDVTHLKDGCSLHGRKLIHLLSEGPATKEMIVQRIWRQDYSPLKHDGSIYALIAKVRKTLGSTAHWIEAYELGYKLMTGVRVSLQNTFDLAGEDSTKSTRQTAILDLMSERDSIEPSELVQQLGVSDATISRDMTSLVESGLIIKLGRGRATRYQLAQTSSIGV